MASSGNVSKVGNTGPRRRAREIALQILHAMDVSPELSADEALKRTFAHVLDAQGQVEEEDAVPAPRAASVASFDRPLVEAIVRGFETNRAAIDEVLTNLSRNWRVERMAVVERNIIRLALYELKFNGGEAPVPVNVALDEAIELAKRFGTAEGAAFVNGMLDRALTELDLRR